MSDVKTLYNQLTNEAAQELLKMSVVAFNLGKPAVLDDDLYVTSADMANGAYTLADTAPDMARNIRITITQQGSANDTHGTVTIVGKDILGNDIEEVIEPDANTTTDGEKAFASISSITQAGWEMDTTADKIKIGTGNAIGLPVALSTTDNILLCTLNRSVQSHTASVGDPGSVAETTVDASAGTYNASKVMQVLVRPE